MTARPAPDGFCSCPPVGDGVTSFSLDCGIGSHRDRARIPVARPAPEDSRVEKLADYWKDPRCEARHFIHEFESAGLLVLDPKSDELVERIADVLVMFVIFGERTHALDVARAIAANLGGGK